jgi:hypothetical protein
LTIQARQEAEVAATLAALSTEEIVSALGAAGLPRLLRAAVKRVARGPSDRLGRTLAHFDGLISYVGLARAARAALESFGARLAIDGAVARSGPLLVVANHPGAYDALALLAALGRDDVAFVAADRPFLRAMPGLFAHLVVVDDERVFDRVAGLRRALAWLEKGGTLIQFGAGAIEPDARFADAAAPALGSWSNGSGVLASRAALATVVPAFVAGVHSPRAKRLPFVRWAEARGVTTVAPLVQATVPGFRDVSVSVRLGAPISVAGMTREECTERLKAAVAALR